MEISKKIENDLKSLERHKKFANAVRTAPLAFWDLGQVDSLRCVCCNSRPSHISTYPFFSSGKFARQIIVWCSNCGFGMVPKTSFELANYYREEYATENRGDRNIDPETYFAQLDSDNPPKNLQRYVSRAKTQCERIRSYVANIGTMLDVGAGPGYALHVSDADNKFALEYDEHSSKYLDYIGAEVVSWDNVSNHRYDVILLSHSLEHFQYSDVRPQLSGLISALNEGGILYIEVPPGGMGWKHYNYKHEPHTLFFTPEALRRLGDALGGKTLFCEPTVNTYDKIEDRDDAIYEPEKQYPLNDPRGGLTLIIRK